MNKTIFGTLPLLALLAACELQQGADGQTAASGAKSSAKGSVCVDAARYNLVCAAPTTDPDGFPTIFCAAPGLDGREANMAFKDTLSADLGEGFYVDYGAFRAAQMGYTDADLEGMPIFSSGVMNGGDQYQGFDILVTNGKSVSICE